MRVLQFSLVIVAVLLASCNRPSDPGSAQPAARGERPRLVRGALARIKAKRQRHADSVWGRQADEDSPSKSDIKKQRKVLADKPQSKPAESKPAESKATESKAAKAKAAKAKAAESKAAKSPAPAPRKSQLPEPKPAKPSAPSKPARSKPSPPPQRESPASERIVRSPFVEPAPKRPSSSANLRNLFGGRSRGTRPSFGGRSQYRLISSNGGRTVSLVDSGGKSLGKLPIQGDRVVGVSPGKDADSYLVILSGGRTLKLSGRGGRISSLGELPALPGGSPAAITQAKDGTIYVASNRGGRGYIYTFSGGTWKRSAGLGGSVTRIKTITTDPRTGELVMLANVPGTSRLAVIRSDKDMTDTATFLLPADTGSVQQLAVQDGEITILHGDGSAKVSSFDANGQLTGSEDYTGTPDAAGADTPR